MQLTIIRFMSDAYINFLVSKSIHILLSHNTNYSISDDILNNKLTMSNVEDNMPRKIEIHRNGDSFGLTLNDANLCVEDQILSKCPEPGIFDFAKSRFGYRILHYGDCLTLGKTLEFTTCEEENKFQDFVFENKSKKYCGDQISLSSESEPSTEEEISQKEKKKRKEMLKLNKDMDRHGIKDEKTRLVLLKLWNWRLTKYRFEFRSICKIQ